MESMFKTLDAEAEHKDTVLSFFPSMFKVNDFIKVAIGVFRDKSLVAISEALTSQGKGQIPIHREQYNWFGNGINCEILSPGAKGWQKGKVRFKVTLEFCPDEPEVAEVLTSNGLDKGQSNSLLDDVRRMTTKKSQ